MLHAVGRGRGTIKQAARKLRDLDAAYKAGQMHRMHPRTRGYTTAGKGCKATIAGTLHDKNSHLIHAGVGNTQLRCKGNRQSHINEPQRGQTVDFEFEIIYNK